MKKIVALVLAMVMVLGLATTAFAATTSTGSESTTTVTPVKAAVYDLATLGGSMTQDKNITVATINKTTVSGKIIADVPQYVPVIWDINGKFYIEVAKAAADHALYNNGTYFYLYETTCTSVANAIATYATPVAMDALELPADDEVDCGEAFVTVATGTDVPAAYYVSGKNVYYAGGNDFAYFKGEFVKYNKAATVLFKAHVWDYDTLIVKATDVKGVQVPVSVECADCEEPFSIVSYLAFDNTWVEYVNYQALYEGETEWFVVLNASTSANTPAAGVTDGETVESAKTFDAGIAMYVGMSVMAAAGSAVVLKKKD